MSIAILFLPVAIALSPVMLVARLVMGKEGFENFLESGQYRVRTDFSSEEELSRAMKKSGCDLVHFMGSLKTHLKGESDYFFWEMVDDRWEAVFSKHNDAERLRQFMERVEQAVGHHVFNQDAAQETAAAPMLFTTSFNDADLLQKAWRDFGANPRKTETIVAYHPNRGTKRQGQGLSGAQLWPRHRLKQINLMMTINSYRHCEERSDVAIQKAVWIAMSLRSSQ
jgi:hypothetical protein